MGEGGGRRRERWQRGRIEGCFWCCMDGRRKIVIKYGEARRSYSSGSIARERRARETDSEVLEGAGWHWMWSRRGQNTDRMP